MAYNRVYDWKKNKTLYTTRKGIGDAIKWMMLRADKLDHRETSVDEVQEDGKLTGWWTIEDLLDENGKWQLADGTIVHDKERD